jgi:serine/threonine protein kinase
MRKPCKGDKLVALGAGGNACALKWTNQWGETRLLRITNNTNESDLDNHKKIAGAIPWFVPAVLEEEYFETYAEFIRQKKEIVKAMEGLAECKEHLDRFKLDPDNAITVVAMEFAEGGTLDALRKLETDPVDFRSIFYLLIGGLYVAQYKLSFEHLDLTGLNIVLQKQSPKKVPHIVPKLIDFDFLAFQQQAKPNRAIGSLHVRPIEFSQEPTERSTAWRQVLGACDIWALGIALLGMLLDNDTYITDIICFKQQFMKPDFRMDLSKVADPNLIGEIMEHVDKVVAHYAVCALHCVLFDYDWKNDYPKHKRRFGENDEHDLDQYWPDVEVHYTRNAIHQYMLDEHAEQIKRLELDERKLLRRMLKRDANKRIFNGNVWRYFDMEYFQLVPETQRTYLLKNYVYPYLGIKDPKKKGFPSTLGNEMTQIRNICELGLAICVDCGKKPDFYDTHRRLLVCDQCK